jgi:subtilase family serine protease
MKLLPTQPDVSRPLPPFDRPAIKPKATRMAPLKALFAGLALAVAAGCAASNGTALAPHGGGGRNTQNIARALPAVSPTPAPAEGQSCDDGNGDASCHVQKNPNAGVSKTPSSGLTPAQLRSAYNLTAASGGATPTGPLVAVVDAFEDKYAESDLATYRAQFGLPACTTDNGCFKKVIMTGASMPPGQAKKLNNGTGTTTWADEIALDLAMASAACPTCRLMLVEAGGQDLDSLASAVNTAASFGPAAISNSWGVVEGGGNSANIDAGAQAAFNHPGIAITASAGDLGQVQFPASSPYVTSVGGTTLTPSAGSGRGWTETPWANTGSGCSIMFAVPSWQTGSACTTGRAVPDVSVIADYNPGVAVYSTVEGGWVVLGGTSAGAPFVAGLYAAANDYGASTVGAPSLYANASRLNVLGGSALGSPNGLAGF